jgi:thiamine-phosphate pyrophosphorylase
MTRDAIARLREARLYGIVDLGYVSTCELVGMTRLLCEGGVDLLQLRAKAHSAGEIETFARSLLPVTRDFNVPLVINDHPEVASEVGSEGVHVGQDDEAVAKARALVGDGCFVGKSTHSLSQAVAAVEEGADYIGFGPLYATGTKPDYVPIGLNDVSEVHRLVQLPVFCIGGVNDVRLNEVMAAGARRVVVVSAFLQATDVVGSARNLKRRLLVHGL